VSVEDKTWSFADLNERITVAYDESAGHPVWLRLDEEELMTYTRRWMYYLVVGRDGLCHSRTYEFTGKFCEHPDGTDFGIADCHDYPTGNVGKLSRDPAHEVTCMACVARMRPGVPRFL
jgi:hypothetical protein